MDHIAWNFLPKERQIFLNFSLVLGGARSGKSAFAEKLCKQLSSGDQPPIYIATAQAFDEEMVSRIEQHKIDRGSGWTTMEVPMALAPALEDCPSDQPVLIDCLTLWLSNRLLAIDGTDQNLDQAFDTWVAELASALHRDGPTIAVTNEVGMGLVPDTPLGRQFRDLQGRLNQRLAAQAGRVIFVAAGLPLVLKGTLPGDAEPR